MKALLVCILLLPVAGVCNAGRMEVRAARMEARRAFRENRYN